MKQTRYQAVFFDLDGTLYDTAPDLLSAIIKTCQKNGYDLQVPQKVIQSYSAYSSRHMLASALNIALEHPLLDTLMPEFYNQYEQQTGINCTLFDGMETLLYQLEAEQIPWGIVTNKATRHAQKFVQRKQLENKIIALVCADTLAHAKPSPEPLLYACQKAQVPPNQAIYLGDAPTDIQAAKAAGLTSVACLWGYLPENNPPENWGADHLIHHPNEIHTILWTH